MLRQARYLIELLGVEMLESIKEGVLGRYASGVAQDRHWGLESQQALQKIRKSGNPLQIDDDKPAVLLFLLTALRNAYGS